MRGGGYFRTLGTSRNSTLESEDSAEAGGALVGVVAQRCQYVRATEFTAGSFSLLSKRNIGRDASPFLHLAKHATNAGTDRLGRGKEMGVEHPHRHRVPVFAQVGLPVDNPLFALGNALFSRFAGLSRNIRVQKSKFRGLALSGHLPREIRTLEQSDWMDVLPCAGMPVVLHTR